MEKHSIYDVFTPTKPATLTFVERDVINTRLVDALALPGKQIVVYGHSGSGKTTLLVNKLQQTYESHLTTRCMVDLKFEHLVIDAFDQLNPFFSSEQTRTSKKSISSALSTEYFGIKAKIGTETSTETQTKQQRILPPQLTPQRLAQFIGEANCCWVLEDFHKLSETEKKKLSQVMKIFMDMAVQYRNLKIVAIGAVATAREVVEYDQEMKNRVAEISVPLMSQEELESILTKGEELLNLAFQPRIKDAIAVYSNGLASVCHQLALNCCLAAGINETADSKIDISTKEFENATTTYVADESDSIRAAFDRAVRQQRERKYDNCRLILEAITKSDSDEGLTTAEIVDKIKRKIPNYPPGNVTIYLKELQSEKRSAIIRMDPASGKFSFSNPFHRVYAQIVFSKRKRELPQFEFKLQDIISDEAKDKMFKILVDLASSVVKEATK